jgi:hypothetical protein
MHRLDLGCHPVNDWLEGYWRHRVIHHRSRGLGGIVLFDHIYEERWIKSRSVAGI